MKILSTAQEAHQFVRDSQLNKQRVALVPTMGALHQGHISLVDQAKQHADLVVATIFVNPLQFNNLEDLQKYPKTIEADIEKLSVAGVAALFLPSVEEIYPQPSAAFAERYRRAKVIAGNVADGFCGASRPGHFEGVTTVVATLFNILPVDCAVFGEKDYQQLKVIEQMVADLHIAVKIIPAPLIRDERGLALSSRNMRLSEHEYNQALAIPQILFEAQRRFVDGTRTVEALIEQMQSQFVAQDGVLLDYINVVDTESLKPLSGQIEQGQILCAAFVGPVRLIDNVRLAAEVTVNGVNCL